HANPVSAIFIFEIEIRSRWRRYVHFAEKHGRDRKQYVGMFRYRQVCEKNEDRANVKYEPDSITDRSRCRRLPTERNPNVGNPAPEKVAVAKRRRCKCRTSEQMEKGCVHDDSDQ